MSGLEIHKKYFRVESSEGARWVEKRANRDRYSLLTQESSPSSPAIEKELSSKDFENLILLPPFFGNKVVGSRFYTSVYTEVFGTGITYEYKNYYSPFLLKSISNPPICYREGNSILASRNAHSMNFGNEIGHQIDLNRNLIHAVQIK